jgi:hypothetical protein
LSLILLKDEYSIGREQTARWNVLEGVSVEWTTIWNILSGVTAEWTAKWDVLSYLSKQWTAVWDIGFYISREWTVIWNLATSFGGKAKHSFSKKKKMTRFPKRDRLG